MPDRSGLPSDMRGAGAAMSTAPDAVRGIPGVGYLNHCADTDAIMVVTASTTATKNRLITINPRGPIKNQQSRIKNRNQEYSTWTISSAQPAGRNTPGRQQLHRIAPSATTN